MISQMGNVMPAIPLECIYFDKEEGFCIDLIPSSPS